MAATTTKLVEQLTAHALPATAPVGQASKADLLGDVSFIQGEQL